MLKIETEPRETALRVPFVSRIYAAKGAGVGAILGSIIETSFLATGYLEEQGLEVSPAGKVTGVVLLALIGGFLGLSWGIRPFRENISRQSLKVEIGVRMYVEDATKHFIKKASPHL